MRRRFFLSTLDPITPHTIVEVENPVALSVPNGTAFNTNLFQTTVRVRLSDDTHRQIIVTYAAGSYNGNTNGFYTLTGTLSPTGDILNSLFLTASIVVWVLPIPYTWLDLIDKTKITGGTDNIGRIVHSVTAKVNSGAIQYDANLVRRPSWNGEGTYFNTQNALKQEGTTAVYAPFHDGTQFTIYVVWKQLTMSTTLIGPLYDNINGSGVNKGTILFTDNRTSATRVKRLAFQIARGINGQVPINIVSADNVVLENAWNWAKVTYDGTTVRLYCNGTEVASGAPAFPMLTGNATNLLNFGNMFTVSTQTGMRGYLKHVYMEDSFMSGGDITFLDSWATAMCLENLTVIPMNVYAMVTQSNCSGRALNSSISPELNGRVGAYIMTPRPTPATQTPGTGTINSDSCWGELQLTVNQTTENVATQHGAEMRFGYEMNRFNENCFIIKYGVGGTPFANQGVYNDWNIAATATLYSQFLGLLGTGFDEVTHVFRGNPIWRGLDIMGGETDAIIVGAGALFHGNVCGTVNGWIDAMVALGYTIDDLRIFIWQITDVGGAAYDPVEFALVKAAQAAFPTQYFVDFPSRTANVKGITTRTTDDLPLLDAQHYNHVGQNMRGNFMFEYYKLHAHE